MTTNQYDNLSNEQLADEIGKLDLTSKQIIEKLDSLKDAFKGRNCSAARGELFAVTVSTSTTERLDTKKLREVLGDAVDQYTTTTMSTRITIKASPKLAEVID